MTGIACLFLGHAPHDPPYEISRFNNGVLAFKKTICARCLVTFSLPCDIDEPMPESSHTFQELMEASVRKVLSETTRQGKPRKTRTKKEEVAQ